MSDDDSLIGLAGFSTLPDSFEGLGTTDPPLIGIDPLYSDCALKSSSGSLYYTFSGTLAACSPVFKGQIECCGRKPSSDESGEDANSAHNVQRSKTTNILIIPLVDVDEEITTLLEHLHQPHRFLDSVVPVVTKQGADRILNLAPIAFKYDIAGN
jgi:hypothetical protein